jgi:hypothetical protein
MKAALMCLIVLAVSVSGCIGQGGQQGCNDNETFKPAFAIDSTSEELKGLGLVPSFYIDSFLGSNEKYIYINILLNDVNRDRETVKSDGIINVLVYNESIESSNAKLIYNKTSVVTTCQRDNMDEISAVTNGQIPLPVSGWHRGEEFTDGKQTIRWGYRYYLPVADIPSGVRCGPTGNYVVANFITKEGKLLSTGPMQVNPEYEGGECG